MKKLLILALAFGTCLIPALAPAQEAPDPEMMMKMMELAQPGEEHSMLAEWIGDWTVKTTVNMPGMPEPMELSGTATHSLVLGGRFLQMNLVGHAPMVMEGLTMIGYDRRHEKYTMVGFDTLGTYFVAADGEWDEEAKRLRMYGEDEDPVAGITQKFFFDYYPIDEDSFRFEVVFMEGVFGNAEPLTMASSLFTRVKGE